jgi:hypothetical protein
LLAIVEIMTARSSAVLSLGICGLPDVTAVAAVPTSAPSTRTTAAWTFRGAPMLLVYGFLGPAFWTRMCAVARGWSDGSRVAAAATASYSDVAAPSIAPQSDTRAVWKILGRSARALETLELVRFDCAGRGERDSGFIAAINHCTASLRRIRATCTTPGLVAALGACAALEELRLHKPYWVPLPTLSIDFAAFAHLRVVELKTRVAPEFCDALLRTGTFTAGVIAPLPPPPPE